jgi:hypothetical protein
MRSLLLFWAVVCGSGVLQSCKVADTPSAATDQTPAIVFLNYAIQKDSGQTVRVELINKIITGGTVKGTFDKTIFKTGDLKCISLDENRHSLNSIYIPDPLHKFVEYEDSTGHLTRKEVWLDSTEFSVRMQLPAKTKFVAIERMDTAGNSTLQITEIN